VIIYIYISIYIESIWAAAVVFFKLIAKFQTPSEVYELTDWEYQMSMRSI
jgi:hypothetical protein